MTTFATKPATRGWQGAVLRLLGADDFLLTVTGVDKITDHYVRVYFDDGGLLAHKGVHPTMWIRLWFDNDGKPHQRAYTLVDPDPVAGTFAIEFAIHDGPASQWAEFFRRRFDLLDGDGLVLRIAHPCPDGWLIAGDAASLPAINSLLEAIAVSDSPDVPVTVWMEYQHDDEYALPCGCATTIGWVGRPRHRRYGDRRRGARRRLRRHRLPRLGGYRGCVDARDRHAAGGGTTDWVDRGHGAGVLDRRIDLTVGRQKHFGRTDFRGRRQRRRRPPGISHLTRR